MLPHFTLVGEVVAHRVPRRAAVLGALDHLADPPAGLGSVDPVLIHRRALDVVDLPSGKVRPIDRPVRAPLVRSKTEGALAGPHQDTSSCHSPLPLSCRRLAVTILARPDRRRTPGPIETHLVGMCTCFGSSLLSPSSTLGVNMNCSASFQISSLRCLPKTGRQSIPASLRRCHNPR